MACGGCQKRKEEFLRKQNELKGIKTEIPVPTPPKPVVKEPEWRFAKTPRLPKIQVDSHNQLMALKNAERIQNKLKEIEAEKQKRIQESTNIQPNIPKEQTTPPYRKTN